jgi:hypothetical protein
MAQARMMKNTHLTQVQVRTALSIVCVNERVLSFYLSLLSLVVSCAAGGH